MQTTHSKYKRKATQIRTVLINCRGWFSNCLVDSSNSKATSVLWVSEWVSGWGRLKLHPPLIIYEGADTTHITSNRKLYLCTASIRRVPLRYKGPVFLKFTAQKMFKTLRTCSKGPTSTQLRNGPVNMLNCKINGTVHIFFLKNSYLSPRWTKLPQFFFLWEFSHNIFML